MKSLLFSLALFLALIATQTYAQPQPQDSTDVIWMIKTDNIMAIKISPDSKLIVTDCNKPLNVKFFDIINGSLIKSYPEETSAIYSKDGTLFITKKKNTIIIRKTDTWEIVKTITADTLGDPCPNVMDISIDNKLIANPASYFGLQIFDVETGKKIKQLVSNDPKNQSYIGFAKFNPEGTQIYFSGNGTLVYDINNDSIIYRYDEEIPIFSPDNVHFANMGFDGSKYPTKRWLSYYDRITKNLITKIYPAGAYDFGCSFNFCFSPDGKYVITASMEGDGLVEIWDINTGIRKYVYKLPVSTRSAIACSNDNNFVITSSGIYLFLLGQKYTSVEDNTEIVTTLSPNPTTGIVKIDFVLKISEIVNFSLSDNSGRLIYTNNLGLLELGNNSYSYNTSSLASGIYFITLQSNTFSQTYKLVKE